MQKGKAQEKQTFPPTKANVSAAIILLNEINEATRPTVHIVWPPRRGGQDAANPAKH